MNDDQTEILETLTKLERETIEALVSESRELTRKELADLLGVPWAAVPVHGMHKRGMVKRRMIYGKTLFAPTGLALRVLAGLPVYAR